MWFQLGEKKKFLLCVSIWEILNENFYSRGNKIEAHYCKDINYNVFDENGLS